MPYRLTARNPQSHVVGLHRVHFPLELDDELVELVGVGHDPVGGRCIGVFGIAPVSRSRYPAVHLDSAVLDRLSPGAAVDRLHEGIHDGSGRDSDQRIALVLRHREWWRVPGRGGCPSGRFRLIGFFRWWREVLREPLDQRRVSLEKPLVEGQDLLVHSREGLHWESGRTLQLPESSSARRQE